MSSSGTRLNSGGGLCPSAGASPSEELAPSPAHPYALRIIDELKTFKPHFLAGKRGIVAAVAALREI
jgi:hypothetical protein